jgi:hypothetical protein
LFLQWCTDRNFVTLSARWPWELSTGPRIEESLEVCSKKLPEAAVFGENSCENYHEFF